jgi:hypothetical protein
MGVVLPLTLFRYKIVLLETMDPAGHPSFKVHETKELGQCRVDCTQVELLSVEAFLEVFQHLHNSQ